MKAYRICSRCISDTSIKGIKFDSKGVCSFCKAHDELEKQYPLNEEGGNNLVKLVSQIKKGGENKKYDCIVGLSGGTDSTYLLYKAVELGLRPLAVHLDIGWNTQIASNNIDKAVSKLGADLKVIKLDYDEFNDIQATFLKASVPDVDIPTDIAILKTLYSEAANQGLRYILNGHSFRAEGLAPLHWTYMDGKYIQSVHKQYGTIPLKTFPNLKLFDLLYFTLVRRIKVIPLLSYFDYNKEKSKVLLSKELDWEYYGGHHYDNLYTRFIISSILWQKFSIDKRITEYSAHVRSGQMTREEALTLIQEPVHEDSDIKEYCLQRIGISNAEYENIINAERHSFLDYSTYYSLIKLAKLPIYIACQLHILPKMFYEKYFA
jgi:N-acetyl sugar amidotransferase